MKKQELATLYSMMFPDYPDIVSVAQLMKMLGISRHLAYDLINGGDIHGIKTYQRRRYSRHQNRQRL